MGKYTAEQVEAVADAYFQDTEDVDQCGAMLRAFAATLRQQGGRGDGVASKLNGQMLQAGADALEQFIDWDNADDETRYACIEKIWRDMQAVSPPLLASVKQDGRVDEDDDGMPMGYASWYNRQFAGQHVDGSRDHACEAAWRAALAQNAQTLGDFVRLPDAEREAIGQSEAVAWMRESGAPSGSETSVITNVIRDLWLKCNPLLVERYTIPLYLHAECARVPDVNAIVDRFLGWTLPQDFAPDAGISFKPTPNPYGDPYPWPTGTNLLHAGQAKAMFEYVLAAPSQPAQDAENRS